MLNKSNVATKNVNVDFSLNESLTKSSLSGKYKVGTLMINNQKIDMTMHDIQLLHDTISNVRDVIYRKVKLGLIP